MVSTWSWSSEWSGSDQLDGLDHPLNRIRWSSHQQRQQQGFLRSRPNQPGRRSPPGTRDISFYNFQFSAPMTGKGIKTISLSTCVGLSSLLHIRTQMHIFHNLVVFVYDQVNDEMKLMNVFRCWKCKASRLDGCKCICEWQDEISHFNLSFKRNRNDKLRYEWSRQGSRKFDGDSYLLWPEIDGL